MLHVLLDGTFETWRTAARRLLVQQIEPAAVFWTETGSLLPAVDGPGAAVAEVAGPGSRSKVPKEFVSLAVRVACFRSDERWPLMYRVLWRLTHGEPRLLDVAVDDDVHRLLTMGKAVRRDAHKMKAFVRFRKVESDDAAGGASHTGGEHYVAWHRPDHLIVKAVAPFFRDRFGVMRWTILTPDASASWDGAALRFGPGVPRSAAPESDELEDVWRTYYAAVFNPARVKLKAMRAEMPLKHWATLPETEVIAELLRNAPRRVEQMMKRQQAGAKSKPGTAAAADPSRQPDPEGDASCPAAGSAAEFVPASRSLPVLRKAAETCKGCPLYCNATQVVFGEGPADATIVFIGEQPGDQEDRAGRPFVGPAGQLLDEALQQVGIPRDEAYVTNAVKHFKFEPRGTRRIHAKPSAREVSACRPWLQAEIATIKPRMIVCLGATAAQTLMGPAFRVTQQRGQVQKTEHAPWLIATIHPSALLRIPDDEMRQRAHGEFLDDLRLVAKQLHEETKGKSPIA